MNTGLKLLYHGLNVKGHAVAEGFSSDELTLSPLGQGLGAGSWHVYSDDILEKEMDVAAPIYLAGRATSSLDLAHELVARHEFPVWSSALVLQQSAGRGQMRREWISPPGNIYAALRLPMTAPFHNEAAAPALGVFVAHALESLGFHVGLKWPNDILQVLHEGKMKESSHDEWTAGSVTPTAWRKAGGILLEERNGALLAGIGLNLASSPDAARLREGFAIPAGRLMPRECLTHKGYEQNDEIKSIADTGDEKYDFYDTFDLVPLWAQLVKKIILCYGSSDYSLDQSKWLHLAQKLLAFKGWKVRLDDAVPEDFHVMNQKGNVPCLCDTENQTVIGWMDGICPSGALRLRTETGLRTFFGGSLTPLP